MSKVRNTAYKVFLRIDNLATKYTKHQGMKKIIDYFIRPRITNLILNEIPEEELRIALLESHNEIEDITDEIKMAKGIKIGEKLGSPKIANVGEIKEIRDLIP